MTALESFILNYPTFAYIIILVALLLESDVSFLTASILATQHYLRWEILIPMTFIGLILWDSCWYFFGAHSKNSRLGQWILKRSQSYHEWLDRNFIGRYARLTLFSKFVPFLSRVTPFLAGWHKMDRKKFLRAHLRSMAIWIIVMIGIGYLFGTLVSAIGVKVFIRRFEVFVIGLFLLLILFGYGARWIFKKLAKTFDAIDRFVRWYSGSAENGKNDVNKNSADGQ